MRELAVLVARDPAHADALALADRVGSDARVLAHLVAGAIEYRTGGEWQALGQEGACALHRVHALHVHAGQVNGRTPVADPLRQHRQCSIVVAGTRQTLE